VARHVSTFLRDEVTGNLPKFSTSIILRLSFLSKSLKKTDSPISIIMANSG